MIQNPETYFSQIADEISQMANSDEVILGNFSGEVSDFCRLNQNRIRQAGSVTQNDLSIRLIHGKRHASQSVGLTGDHAGDLRLISDRLEALRNMIPALPEDPYLRFSEKVTNSRVVKTDETPNSHEAIEQIISASDLDLVGIWANGGIFRGFFNSLGQRNWHESYSFNLDVSFYLHGDKAVKESYAGSKFIPERFGGKVEDAKKQLEVLARPVKKIPTGTYKVFLDPSAMVEIFELLSWSSFSTKSIKTKSSPLHRLCSGNGTLSKKFNLDENPGEGIAQGFDQFGFMIPEKVSLINGGRFAQALTSARSAVEYGEEISSNSSEGPSSLQLAPGDTPSKDVCQAIGTGIYINNLWYLNFSDRNACRITGMTRFATFWVENGEIVAPLEAMRFDESIYRMFGENLVDFTVERETIIDSSTYGNRGVESWQMPGALIDDLSFTL